MNTVLKEYHPGLQHLNQLGIRTKKAILEMPGAVGHSNSH